MQATMSTRSRKFWIIAGFQMLILVASPARAKVLIHPQVGFEDENNIPAVKSCADELVKRASSISTLAPEGLTAVPLDRIRFQISQSMFPTSFRKFVGPYVEVTDRSHHFDLIKVPFAFRDAEHFLAFMQSGDFYRQLRDTSEQFSPARLAIAYGGFFQMFSKSAAVTEPKHLYGRFVGGTVRVPEIYRKFGAHINIHSGLPTRTGLDEMAASDLRRNDRETHIVEAHLGSAIENGFKDSGRFLNLVSSSVLVVDIVFVNTSGADLSSEELTVLRTWAEEAALACSRANFEKELQTLEALKASGYQIVPFNRRALVEQAWRTVLDGPHEYWTIDQFDRLVRLGDFPKDGLVPSALLSKMSPEQRKKALSRDNEAKSELRARGNR